MQELPNIIIKHSCPGKQVQAKCETTTPDIEHIVWKMIKTIVNEQNKEYIENSSMDITRNLRFLNDLYSISWQHIKATIETITRFEDRVGCIWYY